MDTMSAFMRGEAAREKGHREKVFDWDRAAVRILEVKPSKAAAGLCGDWEWTGGDIYRDGQPILREETYVYLASVWATPELSLDGYVEDCWRYEDEVPEWDAHTYWPESSLKILNGGVQCQSSK